MARFSFASCGVTLQRSEVTSFFMSQGTIYYCIIGSIIVTVSGSAQSANMDGFCDTCFQYCKYDGDAEKEEVENKGVLC